MFNITPDEAKEKFLTLSFNGKKLVPDIFGRAIFSYVAEIEPDQSVKLSGIFKINKKEFTIEEIDHLFQGPPAGFIKNIFLYFIGSDVTYRELKRLPCKITLNELEEIKEEEVELILFGEEHIKKAACRLILQDPYGITAKLVEGGDVSDLQAAGYTKKNHEWICPSDKVHESLSLLHACGWKIETLKGEEVLPFQRLELSGEEVEGSIQLKGKAHFQDFSLDIALIGHDRFVKIEDKKVGLLPPHFKLPRANKPGDYLKLPKEKIGLIADYLGVDVYETEKGLFTPRGVQQPGHDFIGSLRPYQLEGLSWLMFLYQNRFSGFLADDMGLGKTVQTLSFLSKLPSDARILIILPTSLQFNWLAEIRRFLPSREKMITLATYGALRTSPEVYQSVEWTAIILDEAQVIKNASTQIFKAVSLLRGRFRLSISGTPIENSLSELINHFKFLIPTLELSEDPSLLKKLTAPFILRRKKEQVLLELPEKIEETVWVDFSGRQQEIYDRYLADAKAGDLENLNSVQILEVILRLRQIACHPKLAGFNEVESAKMEAILSDIDTLVAEGRKILVFSQFTSMLQLIANELDARRLKYLTLTGETKDRESLVNSFQTNKEDQIFLISLKAGGVGLNLTAADTVLLYDPWWNLAIEEQAISRAHRMGQKKGVLVKRYVAHGTIEEKIERLKQTKKNLADQVIDEEKWSERDLRELI